MVTVIINHIHKLVCLITILDSVEGGEVAKDWMAATATLAKSGRLDTSSTSSKNSSVAASLLSTISVSSSCNDCNKEELLLQNIILNC